MAYTPPVHSVMRTRVSRALRDTGNVVFDTTLVTDFINSAIADLNGLRPREVRVDIAGADIQQVIPAEDLGGLNYIFLVEQTVDVNGDGNEVQTTVPGLDVSVPAWRAGWELFAGVLDLGSLWGKGFVDTIEHYGAANVSLRLSGYADRDPVSADGDTCPFDALQEEHYVRRHAMVEGFKTLEGDRALFQQWLTQANNTDVSPTQLSGMRSSTESELRRLSREMRRLRRPVMA